MPFTWIKCYFDFFYSIYYIIVSLLLYVSYKRILALLYSVGSGQIYKEQNIFLLILWSNYIILMVTNKKIKTLLWNKNFSTNSGWTFILVRTSYLNLVRLVTIALKLWNWGIIADVNRAHWLRCHKILLTCMMFNVYVYHEFCLFLVALFFLDYGSNSMFIIKRASDIYTVGFICHRLICQ